MPANTALRVIHGITGFRVIQQTFDDDAPSTCGIVSDEEAVLGAYQQLADAMSATLEVTLDGQIVLYTGYFKPSLQKVIDLYEPKPIDSAEVIAHQERNTAICVAAGRYIEAREPTPEDPTPEEYAKQKAAKEGK